MWAPKNIVVWTSIWINLLFIVSSQSILEALNKSNELSRLAAQVSQHLEFATTLATNDITLLAPSDNAFERYASSSELSEEVLLYHVLKGNQAAFTSGSLQYLDTRLEIVGKNGTGTSHILAAEAQLSINSTTFWSGLGSLSYSVGEPILCDNGVIHVIDRPLTVPLNFTQTWLASSFIGTSPFCNYTLQNQSHSVSSIDNLVNVTVFVPMHRAWEGIGSLVNTWNHSFLERVLSYHVIHQIIPSDEEGPVPGSYLSLLAEDIRVLRRNGTTFVNNAKVVGSNHNIIQGGMFYMLYDVLNPDNQTILDLDDHDPGAVAFANATFTKSFVFPSNGISNNPGLSTSQKAMIGVAVPVGTIFILLGSAFTYMRWKSKPNLADSDVKDLAADDIQMQIYSSTKDLTAPEVGNTSGFSCKDSVTSVNTNSH